MILIHRLKGKEMFLNADLIETVEATPDTVITLVDGRKVMVSDSTQEVLQRVTAFRASLLAAAEAMRSPSGAVLRFPVREQDEEG